MIEHDVTMSSQMELPDAVTEEAILGLLTHVLETEGVNESWELAVQFVDDPTMIAAHVEFMDIDEPTDIMTFPYSSEDDIWGDGQHGGDLIISVDRARSHAHYADWREEDEIFFLITHGILHLLGWDDLSDDDRARMLARQQELLDSWEARP